MAKFGVLAEMLVGNAIKVISRFLNLAKDVVQDDETNKMIETLRRKIKEEGIDLDIVDNKDSYFKQPDLGDYYAPTGMGRPQTFSPGRQGNPYLDYDIVASIKKAERVKVIDEGHEKFGQEGEIVGERDGKVDVKFVDSNIPVEMSSEQVSKIEANTKEQRKLRIMAELCDQILNFIKVIVKAKKDLTRIETIENIIKDK